MTDLAAAMLAASFLDPLYNALGSVLAAFYAVIPSFAFAIAMLTITVRVILIPLTVKQIKSQQAMQRIQPEMKRLQTKHKGDRQKLNEEMMKLYKEHQVNPLSGCLPILLQMPLFIVLYRLILDLSKVPPRHLPTDSKLHAALAESEGRMVSFGMDLAEKASGVQGFGSALPFYALIALVVATGYYQQRQMTARMPPGSVNPQMQMVGKVFPAIIGLVSLSIPAGVVVYFIVSNLWQIGQQAVTFRAQGPLPGTAEAKEGKGGPAAGKGARGGAGGGATKQGPKRAPKSGSTSGRSGDGAGANAGDAPSRWWRRPGPAAAGSGPGTTAKKPSATPSKNTNTAKSARNTKNVKNSKNAKGRRPPPSPRPKGLPPSGAKGAKGPRATPPKKDR